MKYDTWIKYSDAIDAGWIHCSFLEEEINPFGNLIQRVSDDFDPEGMRTWCEQRCKKQYLFMTGSILFESEMEANLFKLTWNAQSIK
jgi:hypothetical protein